MAFERAKMGGALIVFALLALLVVATRFNGGGPDREQDPNTDKGRIGITACTDKATGNYIPCPPNLRLREGR